jgi:hypothetical protein
MLRFLTLNNFRLNEGRGRQGPFLMLVRNINLNFVYFSLAREELRIKVLHCGLPVSIDRMLLSRLNVSQVGWQSFVLMSLLLLQLDLVQIQAVAT